MKALILNGAVALRDMADAVDAALSSRLAAHGYEVARQDLTAIDVPDCNGDFGCWTVTRRDERDAVVELTLERRRIAGEGNGCQTYDEIAPDSRATSRCGPGWTHTPRPNRTAACAGPLPRG